jgi:hypothetical protein
MPFRQDRDVLSKSPAKSHGPKDGGLGVSFLWLAFFTPGLTALRPSGRLTPFALRAWASKESNSATGRSAKHAKGDFLAKA